MRPAILSRGYARRTRSDGVVVVSDRERVLAGVESSGDEPQMLARSLLGVPVLVAPDRYLAGSLAERQFGCTVHLLDDGFQHMQLARDINLLVMSSDDLKESLLPAGRLREPLDAASSADALTGLGQMLRGAASEPVEAPEMDGLASGVISRVRAESAQSWRSLAARAADGWHWAIVGGGSVAATFVTTGFVAFILAFGPKPEREDSLAALMSVDAPSARTAAMMKFSVAVTDM